MKRLTMLDAVFLYLETPETPMHVGSVTTFKPAKVEEHLFERFRKHTEARLDLLPSYRRRLERTPLAIDHPVWVTEQKIELDHHIRRQALSKPGGMAELRALVAQLHAVPLDRSRPLWEYHFIEGMEDGGFAVYAKVHHCAMDGVAGTATLGAIFDFETDSGEERTPKRIVTPDSEPNDFIELTSTAIGDFIRQGWKAAKGLPGIARALAKATPNLARDARFLYRYVREMPRTPFNRAISPHRVFATCSLPVHEVRAIANTKAATINDVVLAICAGALRRYLVEHAALPDKALSVGVPASLRPNGDATLNNQVVFTLCRLPTDVGEPLARLSAAKAAGQEAKNVFADMRDLITTDVSILGAPLIAMGLTRLWAGVRGADFLWPFMNAVISNIPGPRQTMYCVGAPATHHFPVSVPYHGCALNITVQSYLDTLDFGLIACRETVADAQRIADLIGEEFDALRAANATLNLSEAVERMALAEPKRAAFVQKPGRVPTQSDLQRRSKDLAGAIEALKRRLGTVERKRPQSRPTPKKARVKGVKTEAASAPRLAVSVPKRARSQPGPAIPDSAAATVET